MATFTPNLNMRKPALNESANIQILNTNFDILDAAYGSGGSGSGGYIKILGTYETLQALSAAVLYPNVGDVYQVGTEAPYTLYCWQGIAWQNIGTLHGKDAKVFFKWAEDYPESDSDMSDTPNKFLGIYSGYLSEAPEHFSDYIWVKVKGEAGVGLNVVDDGDGNITLTEATTISPSVVVEQTQTGHRITITDSEGNHVFNVDDGTNGTDGNDGYSPSATISDYGREHTITIIDKDGTHTAIIRDGVDGQNGQNGTDGVDGGNNFYFGSVITGGSSTPTTYETGIQNAILNDLYFYNGSVYEELGRVYRCVRAGDQTVAQWVYVFNIKGSDGLGNVYSVNGELPSDGDVKLYGEDIKLTSLDNTSVSSAISSLQEDVEDIEDDISTINTALSSKANASALSNYLLKTDVVDNLNDTSKTKATSQYIVRALYNTVVTRDTKRPILTTKTITINDNDWEDNAITITATGITATDNLIVSPDPSSHLKYNRCGVRAVSQNTDSITFNCDKEPSDGTTIIVNVLILKLASNE